MPDPRTARSFRMSDDEWAQTIALGQKRGEAVSPLIRRLVAEEAAQPRGELLRTITQLTDALARQHDTN